MSTQKENIEKLLEDIPEAMQGKMDKTQINPNIKSTKDGKVAVCSVCAFCEWQAEEGNRKQVGCKTGQLERFKKFETRVRKRFIDMITADDGSEHYIMFRPCMYIKSPEYVAIHHPELLEKGVSKSVIHETIRNTISLPYAAVIIVTDDIFRDVKTTIDTFINSTIRPKCIYVVIPNRLSKSSIVEEAIEYLSKIYNETEQPYSIRYVTDPNMVSTYELVNVAVANDTSNVRMVDGELVGEPCHYVVSVRQGFRCTPNWFELLRNNIVDDFFDFNAIVFSYYGKSVTDLREFIMPRILLNNQNQIDPTFVFGIDKLASAINAIRK
jgi:vacuolar-type H+-ATPase subunit F/Vma7